jgi:Family of unknown function (DUF5719)
VRGAIANRAMSLVVLLVAVAAAAGLAVWKHTVTVAAAAPQPQLSSAPVNTVLRACPAPGLAGAPGSQVALIAGPGTAGAGRAVVSRIGASAGAPLASLTQPGALTVTGVRAVQAAGHGKTVSGKTVHSKTAHSKAPSPSSTPSATPASQPVATVPAPGGVVIQATGAMARGLEAEQVLPGGKVSARCGSPGTDFWFIGPGAFSVGHIQLFIMNVGGQPADVDVQAYTDAGPLQGSADTGVAVAPHAMVTQSLAKMLHGTRMIALNVRTSVGQVVAAVEETTGAAHSGAWLPVSAAPGTRMVIPGMPPTAGTRELFVTVPGTQAAHITLNAVTSKGTYHPTGGGGLDIPGGSVAQLSLTSLSARYGALEISSNVPVTASLLTPGGQKGTPGAFSSATPALQEQGVVATNVAGGGAVSFLVLSAPWRAARVRVTEVGAGGGQGSAAPGKVVVVQAQHSLLQQLTAPPGTRRGSAFAVIVTPLPGSGPLYAGRVVMGNGRGGALQSILPVSSALTVVPLPSVQDELVTPGR